MDNQFFNGKRFWKVFSKELNEYTKYFGLSFLCFMGCSILIWLLDVLIPSSIPTSVSSRMITLSFVAILAAISVPSKCYGYITSKNRGLTYALLPASAFEKTLSMFCISSVFSILLIFAGLLVGDTLMHAITPQVYPDVIFAQPNFILTLCSCIFSVINVQAFFVLGNLLFKKQKMSKTFACLIGLGILFSIIMFVIVNVIGPEAILRFMESHMQMTKLENMNQIFEHLAWEGNYVFTLQREMMQIPFIRTVVIISTLSSLLEMGLCWWGTYRLLKTSKY